MKIQDLIDARARTWAQMAEILDRADKDGTGLSGEDETRYAALEKEYDEGTEAINRAQRHEARRTEMEQVVRPANLTPQQRAASTVLDGDGNTAGDYAVAFNAWARYGSEDLTREQRGLLRDGLADANLSEADLRVIRAAQGVGTGSAGGFLVPPEFRNALVETLKFYSGVRQVAEGITTDTGASLPWMTNDDTANVGAIVGENTQITEQDLAFGTVALDVFMYTSRIVRVSLQLIQDSAININTFLPRKLGERIGRIQNQHFTTGTGTGQPLGLVTGGTAVQAAVGQATAFTYDSLVDVTDRLDPAYLGGGNLAWMGSQAARSSLRKLKDTQNRPLWQPSLQAGVPDTFLGYGWVLNNDMPAPAASAKSLAFGDFRAGYVVRDVTGVNVLRLTERYADFLQVGFLGFQRAGGRPQNTSAYTVLQHSAT